jgi:acetyl esterase
MSAQKTIARALLKLPAPVLRFLSGGGRVVRGGRELDAHFQFIAAQAAKAPIPDPLTPEFARQGTELLTFLFGGECEPGVSVETLTIPGPAADLPARAYRPASPDAAAPLLVFFHFGGGVVGSLDTCDAFCTILASVLRGPVLSVDYRLAPEHRWPANLEDARAAFDWARDNAGQFGVTGGRVAVGGDSMGGHMSAVLCQDLKRDGVAQPLFQLLIYPASDLTLQGGSMETCADAYPLTAATMAFFMHHYLPEGADMAHLRLSPLKNPDLTGLAPALVFTAGHDPLLDQGKAYADALEAAGVPVHYHCYDARAQGFNAYTGGVPAADAACRDIARHTARAARAMHG